MYIIQGSVSILVAVFFNLFLMGFSAACWALFYNAETERLSNNQAKSARIASICILVVCVLSFSYICIYSVIRQSRINCIQN